MNDIKEKLETIYRMLFRSKDFKRDYGRLCTKVNSELLKLYKQKQYGLIIAIGNYLDIEFDDKMSGLDMSKQVIEYFTNMCLSHQDLAYSYLLYSKAKIPTISPKYVKMVYVLESLRTYEDPYPVIFIYNNFQDVINKIIDIVRSLEYGEDNFEILQEELDTIDNSRIGILFEIDLNDEHSIRLSLKEVK